MNTSKQLRMNRLLATAGVTVFLILLLLVVFSQDPGIPGQDEDEDESSTDQDIILELVACREGSDEECELGCSYLGEVSQFKTPCCSELLHDGTGKPGTRRVCSCCQNTCRSQCDNTASDLTPNPINLQFNHSDDTVVQCVTVARNEVDVYLPGGICASS